MAELHRMHASVANGKGGNSFDVDSVRWRGEAGKGADKRAMARRLAVCWNVCEGWPTEALEAGVLRNADTAAQDLLAALDHVDLTVVAVDRSPEICGAMKRLREALAKRDTHYDLRNGLPHDLCRMRRRANAGRRGCARRYESGVRGIAMSDNINSPTADDPDTGEELNAERLAELRKHARSELCAMPTCPARLRAATILALLDCYEHNEAMLNESRALRIAQGEPR